MACLSPQCFWHCMSLCFLGFPPTPHCPFDSACSEFWGLYSLAHGGETVWSCLNDCISSPSSYSMASSPRQPSAPWVQSLLWAIEQALFDKIWKGFIHVREQRERLVKTRPLKDWRPIRRLLSVWLERMWSRQDFYGPGGTLHYYVLVIAEGVPDEWITIRDFSSWLNPLFSVSHNLMDVCLLTFFLHSCFALF